MFVIAGCKPDSNTVKSNSTLEQHRPQYHFSPPAHWMNDPNGMVFYKDEYHLFYQYYPDSTVWGPMHWGHAISKDMVHWEHLPIALYPDSLGYIFSGSAVVDWKNTSGLGTEANPPMVAIYTYHDAVMAEKGDSTYQSQGLAYSTDAGRTWIKYDQNPILKNPGIKDFRDPKVLWFEAGKKWIMSLAVLDHVRFYSSSNLISWKLESEFGKTAGSHAGVWECPD
ncbi:MAG: glycoside hydrolase family 32 protein, partial [Bacteroidota bacterium]|nr:glycoside hydrolase family 32 protein [Bacteroidota bacterium]